MAYPTDFRNSYTGIIFQEFQQIKLGEQDK